MRRLDARLMGRMNRRSDSYERNNASGPLQVVNPAATELAAMRGNPSFAAQFDINIMLRYFTIVDATGVWTLRNAAYVLANFAALATQVPAFAFGNSDFAAGFAKLQTQFPLTGGWNYGIPFIYGKDDVTVNGFALTSVPQAQCRVGDLIIPVYFDDATTTVVCFVIIRCSQVAYATLLDAINSDRFVINMLRYIMTDTTSVGLAQYQNQVGIFNLSLFGKFGSDFVSPNSMKLPEQQQDGIIDIPVAKGIDKQIAFGTYVNYDAVLVQWSVFVSVVDKLAF